MRRRTVSVILGCVLLGVAGAIFWLSSGAGSDVERLRGQPREIVIKQFGQPVSIQKFRMSEARTEFRRPLQELFPLKKPGNGQIVIEEITWNDGDFRNTLWLRNEQGKWIVVDGRRWKPEAEKPSHAMRDPQG